MDGKHKVIRPQLRRAFIHVLLVISVSSGMAAPLNESWQDVAHTSRAAELAEVDRLQVQVVELYKEGKVDKALTLARRVAEITERVLGSEHPNLATSLENVATLLIANRKFDEAGQIFQRVIAIKEKTLGEMHRDVGSTLEQYACLLWARGKREEAGKMEKRIGKIVYKATDETEVDYLVKGTAISLPQPRYPDEARRARLMGTVVVWLLIDETGKVVQASGRCADPLLVKLSEEAAYKARFKPTLVSGKPSTAAAYITYNFVFR